MELRNEDGAAAAVPIHEARLGLRARAGRMRLAGVSRFWANFEGLITVKELRWTDGGG